MAMTLPNGRPFELQRITTTKWDFSALLEGTSLRWVRIPPNNRRPVRGTPGGSWKSRNGLKHSGEGTASEGSAAMQAGTGMNAEQASKLSIRKTALLYNTGMARVALAGRSAMDASPSLTCSTVMASTLRLARADRMYLPTM